MSLPIHHDHKRGAFAPHPMPGGLGLTLARGRVHEFCGPARVALAAMALGSGEEASRGPAFWLCPSWLPDRPYPAGLVEFLDPARVIFIRARRPEDLLWTLEEILRSGAAPIALAELPEPPGLTPIRRLHLAAETGAEPAARFGRPPPLGLILTPGDGGAQGVESRWHMAPLPSASTLYERHSAWMLERRRERLAPPARWRMERVGSGAPKAEPISAG